MAIKIYHRLTSGTDTDYTLKSTLSDAATSETITGLTASTGYTFKIVREVGGVNSAPVIVTATTEATEVPGGTTPLNLTIDNTSNAVLFTPQPGVVYGYEILP